MKNIIIKKRKIMIRIIFFLKYCNLVIFVMVILGIFFFNIFIVCVFVVVVEWNFIFVKCWIR